MDKLALVKEYVEMEGKLVQKYVMMEIRVMPLVVKQIVQEK